MKKLGNKHITEHVLNFMHGSDIPISTILKKSGCKFKQSNLTNIFSLITEKRMSEIKRLYRFCNKQYGSYFDSFSPMKKPRLTREKRDLVKRLLGSKKQIIL